MHVAIVAWVFFLLAMAGSTFMRASNVVQSSQSGIQTYRHYFAVQAGPLVYKYLGAVLAFLPIAHSLPAEPYLAIQLAATTGFSFESLADKGLPLLVSGMRKDVAPAPAAPAAPPDPNRP